MQLAAFHNRNFVLGRAAMETNENLPNFIVEDLASRYSLTGLKVGILGMAFKAEIDDTRDSLSYKLGKLLRFNGANVLYSDEYAEDPTFISKEALVSAADVIIIGSPHQAYREIDVPTGTEVVDVWGLRRGDGQ